MGGHKYLTSLLGRRPSCGLFLLFLPLLLEVKEAHSLMTGQTTRSQGNKVTKDAIAAAAAAAAAAATGTDAPPKTCGRGRGARGSQRGTEKVVTRFLAVCGCARVGCRRNSKGGSSVIADFAARMSSICW